jgi:hypothetical protein
MMRKFIALVFALIVFKNINAQKNSKEASFDHNYLDLSVSADTIVIKKDDFTYCRYDYIFPNVEELKGNNLYPMLGGIDAGNFNFVLHKDSYLYSFGKEHVNRISIDKNKTLADKNQYVFDLYLMKPKVGSVDTIFHKTICLKRISKEEKEFRYHHEKFYGKKFSENIDFKEIFKKVIPLPISLDRFLFVYQSFYSGDIAKFSMPEGVVLNQTHYFVLDGDDAFDFRGSVENNIFTISTGPIVFNSDEKEKYHFTLSLYKFGEGKKKDVLLTKKDIVILIEGEGGC